MKPKNVLLLVHPVYPPRLQGIARFAREHGWYLTIADRLSRLPRGWTGDGALATLRGDDETLAFVRDLRRRRIPVVDLTLDRPDVRLPRVSGDHAAFGRAAARHFQEKGFRHAAWYSTVWTNVHALRFGGFAEAWSGEPPRRWVLAENVPARDFDDWNVFTRRLGDHLRAAPRPLAVLTYDDADAARLLAAARAADLNVPDDVAVMGIGNDTVICENQPVPLSSVGHDLERNGYEGAALLDRIMNGEPAPARPVLIPPNGIVARRSTDTVAAANPAIRQALHYIHAHLADPFGAPEIATELGLSRVRLDRLFAAELGHSVGKEILARRLAEAKRLLADDGLTIAQVAARTGFCTPAYFTNTFRRETGIPPRAWRKRV